MKNLLFICLLSTSSVLAQITYPETRKEDQKDTYFGTLIKDPYRWLEDDNSEETKAWVTEQNKVTNAYLSQIPYRDKIRQRLNELWNFPKQSAPFEKNGLLFTYKNNGVQNQSVLYVQEKGKQERVLLDPNKESKEGTTSLNVIGVSKKADYVAYSLSKAGSDWGEINIINVKTGEKLKDVLKWVKFSSIAWRNNGFYYSRYDAPSKGKEFSNINEYHKVYYHELGKTQESDQLIYEDKEHPLRNFHAQVTEDGTYLIIMGSESTSGNSMKVKDLQNPSSKFVTVIPDFENDYDVIDNLGKKLLVKTNAQAPNYKVMLIDPANPAKDKWEEVIGAGKDLLQSVSRTKDMLVISYLKDVSSKLYLYNLKGEQQEEIKLPGLGMVGDVNSDKDTKDFYYSFTSFTAPSTIYKYNLDKKQPEVLFKPSIAFKSEDYQTDQVFYKSKDGTKIPMFITYKKGIKRDGTNPAFLFGYGGFNISYTPEFRIDRAIFLENGGVYAVANIRGGGEYGDEWHKAGTQLKKQNVFDDFISAAEYLVQEKYTTHDKLAIHGRSNGGLLVGSVMTQRPDIAKVAIPTVGVLDMLRYHKFTIGWAWAKDYGTSDTEEHFTNLIKYSPLHNIKPTSYPATLITTGDHDDRVVPAHSFKFAATLQENQKGTEPVLIRIDTNAGHGAGKPTTKLIEEFVDIWSFVFYNLGMKVN